MNHDKLILENWIDVIKTEGQGLTKWEIDFIDNVEFQLTSHGYLTERQEEILERVYSEKT